MASRGGGGGRGFKRWLHGVGRGPQAKRVWRGFADEWELHYDGFHQLLIPPRGRAPVNR